MPHSSTFTYHLDNSRISIAYQELEPGTQNVVASVSVMLGNLPEPLSEPQAIEELICALIRLQQRNRLLSPAPWDTPFN
jgi:hypothetical protein